MTALRGGIRIKRWKSKSKRYILERGQHFPGRPRVHLHGRAPYPVLCYFHWYSFPKNSLKPRRNPPINLMCFLVFIVLTEFGIEGNVKRFTLLCLLDSGLPLASEWSNQSEQSDMKSIPLAMCNHHTSF